MDDKDSNIKDRVVQIAEQLAISKEEFFRSIGMTSANFRGKAKATPLNSNAVVNIITKYPEVDLYWLLSGAPQKEFKTPQTIVQEPELEYHKLCESKDELITVLLQQIEDLKADKDDLKTLLGLKK